MTVVCPHSLALELRPAQCRPVGADAGPHAGADQADDRALGAAPRAEPQLGLAHGPSIVVDVQRQIGACSEQASQRDRLPAVRLPVHETVGSVLDDAGYPDTDAEDRGRADSAGGHYHLKPGQDRLDDQADLVLAGVERIVGLGALSQRQVEQLDPDPGLADVDPDDVPVIRVDLQQRARPPAI